MSADELRQAAETLRSRAEAATPGTWGVGNGSDIASDVEQHSRGSYSYKHMIARLDDMDYDEDYAEPRDNGATEEDDATYIATMHPGVGEALATLLSLLADHAAGRGEVCGSCVVHGEDIARLINDGAA